MRPRRAVASELLRTRCQRPPQCRRRDGGARAARCSPHATRASSTNDAHFRDTGGRGARVTRGRSNAATQSAAHTKLGAATAAPQLRVGACNQCRDAATTCMRSWHVLLSRCASVLHEVADGNVGGDLVTQPRLGCCVCWPVALGWKTSEPFEGPELITSSDASSLVDHFTVIFTACIQSRACHGVSPSLTNCAHTEPRMGAVHGVHLKYAAMSTMCMAGAYRQYVDEATLIEWAVVAILVYSSAVHALITSLFLLRRGEWIMGKDEVRGTVPLWCAMA